MQRSDKQWRARRCRRARSTGASAPIRPGVEEDGREVLPRARHAGGHCPASARSHAVAARSSSSRRTERRGTGSACTARRTDRNRRPCSWSGPDSRACPRTCPACRPTWRACCFLRPIPPWQKRASPAARARARPRRAATPKPWRTESEACAIVARCGGTCKSTYITTWPLVCTFMRSRTQAIRD